MNFTQRFRAAVAGLLLLSGAVILNIPSAQAADAAGTAGFDPGDAMAEKAVPLPAPADGIIPAAGGKILLVRMDKIAKLAVYDVAQDKIKGYVPLSSTDTLVAASADKIILAARDKGVIQRWQLDPPAKELTVAMVLNGQVDGVYVGHASNGPVMVMTRGGPQFLSLQSLKPLDIQRAESPRGMDWFPHPQYPILAAPSADGQTFAGWYRGLSPSGIRILQLQGNSMTGKYEHNSAGVLLPSWDGSLLFTTNGIYSADLKPIAEELFKNRVCIPSYSPSYFLSIGLNEANPSGRKVSPEVSVYTTGDRSLLVKLAEMPELGRANSRYDFMQPGSLPWQERIFLCPQANRLVTVAEARDKLIVRPFDVIAALDRAGIDYLFVESLPCTQADPGKPYRYPIAVRSKKGGVKFTLDSGPAGMKISPHGLLSWDVPKFGVLGSSGVIVTIEDASGQSIFHTFNLQIGQPMAAPPGVSSNTIELSGRSYNAVRRGSGRSGKSSIDIHPTATPTTRMTGVAEN